MILEGNIIKGFGRAKIFINMIEKIFYKKTGMHLYCGTLNIKLDNPYQLKADYIIKSEEYGGDFDVQVQECTIFKKKSYIVRSEKNIKEKGDYGQNIIEIVSNINFRKKYNLKDEDNIEIKVKKQS